MRKRIRTTLKNEDLQLKMEICEDKDSLGWDWRQIADSMGLGEKKAGYLKVLIHDRHRRIPDQMRPTLEAWHRKVRPTLLRLTARVWPWKLEPVAFASRSTTIKDACSKVRLQGAKALIVLGNDDKPRGVFLAKDIIELNDEYSGSAQYKPTLFELGGNATGNFDCVTCDDSYERVKSDLRSHALLLLYEKNKITSVLVKEPTIPIRAPAREKALEYSVAAFPQDVADKLIEFINPFINEDDILLDVASGPGTLTFGIERFALRKFNKEIIAIAAEDEDEEAFVGIFNDYKKSRKLKRVEILPLGRDNLLRYAMYVSNKYNGKFQIIAWNLILPSSVALKRILEVLPTDGIVAVSFYDRETLGELYGIINRAFWEVLRHIPIPKDEMQNVCELAEYICENSENGNSAEMLKIQEKHTIPLEARFKNAEAFLDFLHCASPYVVKCFASLSDYPEAKDAVRERAKRLIEEHYGAVNIATDFMVNFVVARKVRKKVDVAENSTVMDRRQEDTHKSGQSLVLTSSSVQLSH